MKKFYKKMKGAGPRPLLKKAFEFTQNSNKGGKAYDLGCGIGQDTFALVEKGFEVKAVDLSPDAFDFMDKENGKNENVEQIVSSLEELNIQSCDFINASFVLPFIRSEQFDHVLQKIKNSLNDRGLFVGNFFGSKDDWSSRLVTKTMDEVKKYFEDFNILYSFEFEDDRLPAVGPIKHWHIIEIIARR
jgi:SAM-dependent methyltransferase